MSLRNLSRANTMPYLTILKLLAPVLLFVAGLFISFQYGYNKADRIRIEHEARLAGQSNLIIAQATAKQETVETALAETEKTLKETSDEHSKIISDLATANHKLLASRLRPNPRTSRDCNTVSDTSTTPSDGDAPIADTWVVQRAAADRFIDRQSSADQVTETARACQTYVQRLQEILK